MLRGTACPTMPRGGDELCRRTRQRRLSQRRRSRLRPIREGLIRAPRSRSPVSSRASGRLGRSTVSTSHVLNAACGALVLLLGFAVAIGVGAGAVLGDVGGQLRGLLEAALVQLPGVIVIGAVVVAVVALVAISAILAVVGVTAFRRRDLELPA